MTKEPYQKTFFQRNCPTTTGYRFGLVGCSLVASAALVALGVFSKYRYDANVVIDAPPAPYPAEYCPPDYECYAPIIPVFYLAINYGVGIAVSVIAFVTAIGLMAMFCRDAPRFNESLEERQSLVAASV